MSTLKPILTVLLASTPLLVSAQETTVKFQKQVIAFESTESVGVFDVNNDGILDLVSGSFWYKGPEFIDRSLIGQVKRYGEYYEDFSTIPMDVNEDGKMDFVTGGWFEGTLIWKENPGDGSEWPIHEIAKTGNIETTRGWDIDGDGVLEIFPNTPRKPLAFFKKTGPDQFEKYPVSDMHGHGLGLGDINGDGRKDLVISEGWLEAPNDLKNGKWTLHEDFNLGDASIPMIIVDVNGDGLNDIIVGQAHTFGLFWLEQQKTGNTLNFVKHQIDPYQSQYHTMEWVDIDNDGQNELVTGKRHRAHNGKDPGGKDYVGLYYFKWNGESFSKNIISYGPAGEGKGSGLYFSVADLNKDGWKDIAVAGKDGLVIFHNLGNEKK
ncbi:FG-GAP repeat domain-containing protein [Algoriphagus halophilus]|uniref:Repeat domain-containing protein n=1 Tax=Algoriphagus halophilus TaxID=226505 RepID=A0A1N6H4Q4_9BACT|nr:VCBS repeat-containing protein [Algoriphagus halophilus]SIO14770.1 Repeat domain-containing protein [Algoriphagus halophilus]